MSRRLPGLSTSLPFQRRATGGAPPTPPPDPPVADPATDLTDVSFTANWQEVVGADGYYLTVEQGGTPLPGYDGADVGNVLNEPVAGLNPNIPYDVFLNAYNAGGTSADSNVISVTTYTEEAQDYFTRCEGRAQTWTVADKDALNEDVVEIIAEYGSTAGIDRMFIFGSPHVDTAVKALTAFIWNGEGADLTTAFGSPTYTSRVGFTMNGSSYFDPNFNLRSDSTAYTQNNSGIYITSPGQTGNGIPYGADDGVTQSWPFNRFSAVVYVCQNNVETYTNVESGMSDTVDSVQARRMNSATIMYQRDAQTPITVSRTSAAIPNLSGYIGARNTSGSVDQIVNSGVVLEVFTIGDSSMNKDDIAAIVLAA